MMLIDVKIIAKGNNPLILYNSISLAAIRGEIDPIKLGKSIKTVYARPRRFFGENLATRDVNGPKVLPAKNPPVRYTATSIPKGPSHIPM